MPLPWILGAAAVATAAYVLSDDEDDRAEERNREARRDARRESEARAAETQARRAADELNAALNMGRQFFNQYYGRVPHSVTQAQSKSALHTAIKEHSRSTPSSFKGLTQQVSTSKAQLDTIDQLIASLNTLKGSH